MPYTYSREEDAKKFEGINVTIRKNTRLNQLEILVWLTISFLNIAPTLYEYFALVRNIEDNVIRAKYEADWYSNNYFVLTVSFFIIFFPILFKLVFNRLPIESLREVKHDSIKRFFGLLGEPIAELNKTIEGVASVLTASLEGSSENKPDDHKKKKGIEIDFRILCIEESKAISERVYRRSGVYLFVGCLIAFAGLAVFYSPLFNTINLTSFVTSTSTTQIAVPNESLLSFKLLEYLPRFSALFFIEFIAFFFLKQYRMMMEEYRYYEAIKRKRQEDLIFTDLLEKYKGEPEVLKVISDKIVPSVLNDRLLNGESTGILETHKLLNQEVSLVTKFTDLIREVKAK